MDIHKHLNGRRVTLFSYLKHLNDLRHVKVINQSISHNIIVIEHYKAIETSSCFKSDFKQTDR